MTDAQDHVPSYSILVDGEELGREHRDRLKEIRVVNVLRLPDLCVLDISYPKADGVDSMPFEIGAALEVQLGARDHRVPRSLFRGDIVTIEPDFGAGGCAVTVRALDRAHLLNRSRRIRTFQNQTSSDIVSAIVSDAGLTADCEASGEPHDFMQQDNETDWEFIWRLAERIGFEFVVTDRTARFARPAADPTVALEWPKDLRAFRPRVTGVQQVGEVTVRGWDYRTKETIQSTANTPNQLARIGIERGAIVDRFDAASIHVATESVTDRGTGDALAQALLDKLANAYVGADGVAPGNPDIRAGVGVEVKGVGSRFGGRYLVTQATHVLRGGGAYETHFANAPTHTLLASTGHGAGAAATSVATQAAIGIVTDNADPQDLGRVRVKIPTLSPDTESNWARVVVLQAGQGRGALMLPQVDDEVLVLFLHGDTRAPIVVGGLFNAIDPPDPELLSDQDGSFSVRTDAKVLLRSQKDSEWHVGENLVIDVGKEAKVTVTGATTVTGSDKVSVEAMDLAVSAKQGVSLTANTTITLECGPSKIELGPSGVTISGPMVNVQ